MQCHTATSGRGGKLLAFCDFELRFPGPISRSFCGNAGGSGDVKARVFGEGAEIGKGCDLPQRPHLRHVWNFIEGEGAPEQGP